MLGWMGICMCNAHCSVHHVGSRACTHDQGIWPSTTVNLCDVLWSWLITHLWKVMSLTLSFIANMTRNLCQLMFENMSSIQFRVYIEGQPHYYQVKHDAHSVMQTFHITNLHKYHIKICMDCLSADCFFHKMIQ